MSTINFKNSQELFNFQAFIEHVESHLAYEYAAMRMQYVPHHINLQREIISNPILPNLHKHFPMERTTKYDNNSALHAPSNQHSLFSYDTRTCTSQPDETWKFQEKEMEVSLIDGTKSLISLLDRPINNEEFTNQVTMSDRDLDLLFLDLELRL